MYEIPSMLFNLENDKFLVNCVELDSFCHSLKLSSGSSK